MSSNNGKFPLPRGDDCTDAGGRETQGAVSEGENDTGSMVDVREHSVNDVAIRVSGLSKSYQIYDRPQDRLKQSIIPRFERLIGHTPSTYFREFWALKDVSFEVNKGETLGIIGRNGSGKSTLLQMIAGTLTPTGGTVSVTGRVAALLELGSGFNLEFTGRENVFMNGAVLGLRQDEIERRFDEIAAFANIGQFIDQPVKTYSSGMMVRLAFAVSVCVEPDVLIVDEALAVGDAVFQFKCTDRLDKLTKSGTTLLFVSHDLTMVKAFCHNVIYLEQGRMKAAGTADEVTELYLLDIRNEQKEGLRTGGLLKLKEKGGGERGIAFGSEEGRVIEAVFGDGGGSRAQFEFGTIVKIRVLLEYLACVKNPTVSILIQDRRLISLIGKFFKLTRSATTNGFCRSEVECAFKAALAPGDYCVTIRLEERIQDNRIVIIDKQVSVLSFEVIAHGRPDFIGLVDLEMSCVDVVLPHV